MTKKLLTGLFLIACVTIHSSGYAQTLVRGKITSAEDGTALPGVNIVVRGTTIGSISNTDGNYQINVPQNDVVLTFSFIGLTPQDIPVQGRSVIDVKMVADVRQLGEVVVTAFGIEREKKALSYSVQQVSGDRIAAAGNPNVTNALQGKVAGVIVKQSSGLPGASSQITIRGNNSIVGNNTPLYVVDGLPIETRNMANFTITPQDYISGADQSDRSLDINPEDIESINVLKGPAAAALYGLRANNGVVIITTKRGSGAEKGKPTLTVSSDYTVDQVSRLPDLQSTYAQGSAGVFSQGTSLSWGPKIADLQPYQLSPGGIPATVLNRMQQPKIYDNVDPLFRNGGTLNTDVALTGRGDNYNYSIGAGFTTQEGIVPTTGMERMSTKFAGDYILSEKLRAGASVTYSNLSVDKITGGSNLSNPLFTTYFAPRTFDLWGIPYAFPDDPYQQINYRGAMDNPRWSLANNEFGETTGRIIGNMNLSYEPTSWLTFNYRIGLDNYTTNGKEVYDLGSGETGGRTDPPSGGQIRDYVFLQNQINSNINAALNFKLMEDLDLNILVGNEFYNIKREFNSTTGSGLTIGGFQNMANTKSQIIDNWIEKERVVGFYGQVSLGWRNMLFINATGRNDFVSNMPPKKRSFFYPSLGLGFTFTELLEIPETILSFGKVRASLAQVGQSAPSPYSTVNIFLPASHALGGFLNEGIQYPFNGITAFEQSDLLRSKELTPQNTSTYEIGAELRFLNNRVGIDYTYYYIKAADQIFQVPMAPSTGYQEELRNAGELETRGHELVLNINPIKATNFSWDIDVNFSTYENKVKSLAEGVESIYLGGFTIPQVRASAGNVYPVIFGTRYLRDENGAIVVLNDPDSPFHGMPIQDPVDGVIGDVQPDCELSFINRLNFKGFTLTAQLDIREGGEMYAGNTRLAKLYGMDEMTEDRESPFVFEGVKGNLDENNNLVVDGQNDIEIQRDQFYWSSAMDAIDESNVYKTAFIRLREVTLTYSFSTKLLTKTPFKTASIYFTGRNLFLITDYPNFDPETSTGPASNFQGLEYVALPQTRSFGAGLKFSF